MMLRSWIVWGASACVCAALVISAASGLSACSGEIEPDPTLGDGGTDATVPVDSGPVSDAAPPRDVANVDVVQPTLTTFVPQIQSAICARYKECCFESGFDGGANSFFSTTACISQFPAGWNGSATGLNAALAADASAVGFNAPNALECLRLVRTFTCPEVTGTEMKQIDTACFGVLRGTGVDGSPCRVSLECGGSLHCQVAADAGAGGLGVCKPLLDAGSSCNIYYNYDTTGAGYSAEQCSYNGGGAACELVDPMDEAQGARCGTLNANDALCYTNESCRSGLCSISFTEPQKCTDRTVIIPPSIPGTPYIKGTCETFTDFGDGGM